MKKRQTLDQELLQYSSALFMLSSWQDLTALGWGCVGGGGVLVFSWTWLSLKWASLAALLHRPALIGTLLSWHKLWCFFRARAICFQYSSALEEYWGQMDGLASYSQLNLLTPLWQVTRRVRRSFPVTDQVHSDLSAVTSLPFNREGAGVGWGPMLWTGLSLFWPLLPFFPWVFWQLLNTSWWETQASASRRLILVRTAIKSAEHTLQEDKSTD